MAGKFFGGVKWWREKNVAGEKLWRVLKVADGGTFFENVVPLKKKHTVFICMWLEKFWREQMFGGTKCGGGVKAIKATRIFPCGVLKKRNLPPGVCSGHLEGLFGH